MVRFGSSLDLNEKPRIYDSEVRHLFSVLWPLRRYTSVCDQRGVNSFLNYVVCSSKEQIAKIKNKTRYAIISITIEYYLTALKTQDLPWFIFDSFFSAVWFNCLFSFFFPERKGGIISPTQVLNIQGFISQNDNCLKYDDFFYFVSLVTQSCIIMLGKYMII